MHNPEVDPVCGWATNTALHPLAVGNVDQEVSGQTWRLLNVAHLKVLDEESIGFSQAMLVSWYLERQS